MKTVKCTCGCKSDCNLCKILYLRGTLQHRRQRRWFDLAYYTLMDRIRKYVDIVRQEIETFDIMAQKQEEPYDQWQQAEREAMWRIDQ